MSIKRIADIIVAACATLLLSPLLLVIAIFIRIDSRGPAIFRQSRIGRNKEPFVIFKFRTMKHRAAEHTEQEFEKVLSSSQDERITRFGRMLRRTSLDELPQLYNVVVGDMSIVGPRPVLPEQLAVVPELYTARFQVRPGITGLAQIKGRRSLSWEEQLKYDTLYVTNQNLVSDIRIILTTIVVVFSGEGVYGSDLANWRTYKSNKEQ